MTLSIELMVLTRLLISEDDNEIETLLSYDPDRYFTAYLEQIKYIHKNKDQYGHIPSVFEFQEQFPDITILPDVKKPLSYLEDKLASHRRDMILLESFNKIKELGQDDGDIAIKYLSQKIEEINDCETDKSCMDIIGQAEERIKQVQDYAKQARIPTGFREIDEVMYGGLSTVEELLVIIARTGSGKSWFCAKIMDSAQANGFPVAYYSPEMQAAFLATRFDTWRGNFKNSDIFRGQYSPEYLEYIQKLKTSDCPAYIIEDKDFADGVSVRTLSNFVRKNKIKLLIIDGISYMQDDNRATRDQEKFKNIALGLLKKYGCAVIIVMQANREVKSKDSDKGDSIPDLFNAEGSDQPGRIATQAFGLRQEFTEHKLDIKMLKSRNANNQNPVFSYLWSINDGIITYMQEDSTATNPTAVAPNTNPGSFRPITFGNRGPDSSDLSLINDSNTDSTDNEFSDIEF